MTPENSFPDVMARLHTGDQQAAKAVVDRFTRRLALLACRKLKARLRTRLEAEDVLQSVYRSFFRRCAANQFDLDGWDSLWKLLAKITVNKCAKQANRHQTGGRDVKREVSLGGATPTDPAWHVFDREPTPLEAATLVDTISWLTRDLDDRDRTILALTLEGYTDDEISARVGCALSTVARRMRVFRNRLRRLYEEACT